jgi:hypothetical protein
MKVIHAKYHPQVLQPDENYLRNNIEWGQALKSYTLDTSYGL